MQLENVIPYLGSFFILAPIFSANAEDLSKNAIERLGNHITYATEFQSVVSSDYSPLWLNANRYGASSVRGNNGSLRVNFSKDAGNYTDKKWRIGFGFDLITAYNFTNSITLQQCYLDCDYKRMRLSIGSKERPMAIKNQQLSSGGQTLGINARPIPEMRIELPEYISLTGKSNWIGFKGHFGYGLMTDGSWQEDYVRPTDHYVKGAIYHSKAGYIRLGNEAKFPLVFEAGLEMACEFGGTVYNANHREGAVVDKIKMGAGIKDFFKAIFGGGSDPTDDIFKNSAGNTVGSWLFALSYKGPNWKVKAYYDHYFEDHSMMFGQYGWLDGMYGVEFTLPRNRWVNTMVYEFLNTTYQSGPIYHDGNETLPEQISGKDNYYNHNLYQGWQHWGQAIGNPLFFSPLYKSDHSLDFSGNRFKAHHVGISGNPTTALSYRVLFSYMKNWGTYAAPYSDIKRSASLLTEINCKLPDNTKFLSKGWSVAAAFAIDRGSALSKNTGGMITIRKTGLLTH